METALWGCLTPTHCRIVETLLTDHTLIHPFNRAVLVCDSVALAASGHLAPATRDRLLEYLATETELAPLNAYRVCAGGMH